MFFNLGGFIMLKDEWLEYFEAVNGRKPRPIDFKEALERGEFILSEESDSSQVTNQAPSDQGQASPDQSLDGETATAKALAQSQKERNDAQEALANAALEKRKALSQESALQVKTLQSGREAEVLQKEEEQRQRVAEAKERLASYAPTRPDSASHSASATSATVQDIPVFSNESQYHDSSDDLKKANRKEEKEAKKIARQAARDKKKAEKLAAKVKSKEDQTVDKLEKKLESQIRLLESVQNIDKKSQKAKSWGKGALISSLIAVVLMLLIGGVYGFWRNASGNIEGTWKLKTSKVLDENSGKLTNALKEHENNNEIYVSFLKVDHSNNLQTHSYFYTKGKEDQPTFTASDYLKEYQVVDQWNKSITYTKEVSEFKRELTRVVSELYPNADKNLVDYYISDNVDNYRLYRKGKRTKSYTVNKDTLVVSTYNEDGKLTSRDTYEKVSKATAKGLEAEYAEAKVAYEKNHKTTSKK